MKIKQPLAIVLAVSALFFSACNYFNDDKSRAEKVVENYHRLYNEQNYEEIFNSANEDAKATKSKEGLGLALAQSFEKLGKHQSSKLIFSKVTILNTKERQVDFAYKSKFEKGEVNETFLIIVNDQKAALYSIDKLTDEELEKLK